MTIQEYITSREEYFNSWIEDTLNKNDDEFLRHYVQSITLIHSETITTVLTMVRGLVESISEYQEESETTWFNTEAFLSSLLLLDK